MSVRRSLAEFREVIAALPSRDRYSKAELMVDALLVASRDALSIYYAPFDHVDERALVTLVGITPGWKQFETSIQVARRGIKAGHSNHEISETVKREAAFSGPLRKNLVSMLDKIGLPKHISLRSTASLFEQENGRLLHSTSVVRYPVLKGDQNYAGRSPMLAGSEFLKPYLDLVAEELAQVGDSIIVPLGRAVEQALELLVSKGLLDRRRCLWGFPHPSGAYPGRVAQLERNLADLRGGMDRWFGSTAQ